MLGDSLSQIPKLDRRVYVCSYIQSQQKFQQFYEHNETRPLTSDQDESSKSAWYGFETPIIWPRTLVSSVKESEGCRTRQPGNKHRIFDSAKPRSYAKDTTATKNQSENVKRPAKQRMREETTKKKREALNQLKAIASVAEHEQRLNDRKERKRKRKDIMQPSVMNISEGDHGGTRQESQGGNRKKKVASTGMALMHGFVSTSVGKNRITIAPSLPAGLFSKGKASVKTKPSNVRGFSEVTFLNKKRQHSEKENRELAIYNSAKRKKREKTPNSSFGVSSGNENEEEEPHSPALGEQDQGRQSSVRGRRNSSPSTPRSRISTGRIESPVWEIEKEELSQSEIRAYAKSCSDIRPICLTIRGMPVSTITTMPSLNKSEKNLDMTASSEKEQTWVAASADVHIRLSQSTPQKYKQADRGKQPSLKSKYFQKLPPAELQQRHPILLEDNWRGLSIDKRDIQAGLNLLLFQGNDKGIMPQIAAIDRDRFLGQQYGLYDMTRVPEGVVSQDPGGEDTTTEPFELKMIPVTLTDGATGTQETFDEREGLHEYFDHRERTYRDSLEEYVPVKSYSFQEEEERYAENVVYQQDEGYQADDDERGQNLPGVAETDDLSPDEAFTAISDVASRIDVFPFSQGRALLMGIPIDPPKHREVENRIGRIPQVESDVARNLAGHWHPRRW